jgi:hypothetical protein
MIAAVVTVGIPILFLRNRNTSWWELGVSEEAFPEDFLENEFGEGGMRQNAYGYGADNYGGNYQNNQGNYQGSYQDGYREDNSGNYGYGYRDDGGYRQDGYPEQYMGEQEPRGPQGWNGEPRGYP